MVGSAGKKTTFFCNRSYRITNIALDWWVYQMGIGCWSVWSTHDDAPQLSYAASRHNGLTVLGQYKSENVFHILYKTMEQNFLYNEVFYA